MEMGLTRLSLKTPGDYEKVQCSVLGQSGLNF